MHVDAIGFALSGKTAERMELVETSPEVAKFRAACEKVGHSRFCKLLNRSSTLIWQEISGKGEHALKEL